MLSSAAHSQTLLFGNPSNATTNPDDSNNYLVAHQNYILSYNRSRGSANWVAWTLTSADIGSAERTNAFAPDLLLPPQWWIKPLDYNGSGYDRGHLCPSKDRSDLPERNRETFLMSNMSPQTPKLNRKTWKYLEDFERDLARKNDEYILAGCYGDAGRIKDKITIPTNCWKIIVLFPQGEINLKHLTAQTRMIAVDLPNTEAVSSRWRTYLTTVDRIEEKTGYDFFSKAPKKVQASVELAEDDGH